MIATLFMAAALAGGPLWPAGEPYAVGAAANCADWLTATATKAEKRQWMLGVWSGFNTAFGKQLGAQTDPLAIVGEVDKYCRANPKATMMSGLVATYTAAWVAAGDGAAKAGR